MGPKLPSAYQINDRVDFTKSISSKQLGVERTGIIVWVKFTINKVIYGILPEGKKRVLTISSENVLSKESV
jgi:hypothetical protein